MMAGDQQHETIYEGRGSDYFYTPFHLRVAPMERLLLINLQDGQFYKGAEPQWFDDDQHGHGLLVILYRVDGKVDVYHDPALTLDPVAYQIEAGLGEMVACHFERRHFEIRPEGIDIDIAFTDLAGRSIVLRIRERSGKRAGQFALLAPLGETIEDPDAMPLFFLDDFSFVKIAGTDVTVSVGGATRKMVKLPVPLGGSRVYLTRYCGDPFIAFWNPESDAPLPRADVAGAGILAVNGVSYDLVENAGYYEIAEMTRGQTGRGDRPAREVCITFTPPFPNITALRNDASVAGSFRIKMARVPEAGEVRGEWR